MSAIEKNVLDSTIMNVTVMRQNDLVMDKDNNRVSGNNLTSDSIVYTLKDVEDITPKHQGKLIKMFRSPAQFQMDLQQSGLWDSEDDGAITSNNLGDTKVKEAIQSLKGAKIEGQAQTWSEKDMYVVLENSRVRTDKTHAYYSKKPKVGDTLPHTEAGWDINEFCTLTLSTQQQIINKIASQDNIMDLLGKL